MKTLYLISAFLLAVPLKSEPRIWMNSTVNGQEVKLFFDTGSSHSLLFQNTVARLKLKTFPSTLNRPARKGFLIVPHTEEVDFRSGPIFGKMEFGVLDLAPGKAFGTDADGVFSWYLLKDKVFLFNDRTPGLELADELPETARAWPSFKLVDTDVLAFQIAGDDSPERNIYVVTGSDAGVMLSPALWKKWISTRANQPSTVTAFYSPISGMAVKQTLWAERISIGPITLYNVPVMEADAGAAAAYPHRAAELGLYALLRMNLVVDGKNQLVYARSKQDFPLPYPHNRLGAVFPPENPDSDPLLARVAPNSPASAAGIRDNDVLLNINGLDVTKWRTDPEVMPLSRFWEDRPGTVLRLTLKRNNREYETTAILAEILKPNVSIPR